MGNYLSSDQGGGKKVHEEEVGTGDAQPLMCLYHSSFAWMSVSTHLISSGPCWCPDSRTKASLLKMLVCCCIQEPASASCCKRCGGEWLVEQSDLAAAGTTSLSLCLLLHPLLLFPAAVQTCLPSSCTCYGPIHSPEIRMKSRLSWVFKSPASFAFNFVH